MDYKEINMAGAKGKSGGKRIGAGRPAITGKAYNYKADKDLIPILDKQENRNRFINDAVREKSEKEGLL
ncbi:hypothetical protein [Prevotella pallens]|jgi:hypothetical protein|uniref:hypothetical protein n=1 Tax=Prevotella pallens TaxID=60133 RepID=UPI00204AE0EE|nr:hypothetical protein [Prevotella pallens]DAT11529.1 MAG TPA: hypothetical protein [Caudoviricetes sp.]